MNINMDKKGFTLIEILIVVAIIGLLTSVVLVGLAPAQKRGRDARRLADLREVQTALELYYNACGHYPGGTDCSAASGGAVDWGELSSTLRGSSIGVSQIPNDPSSGRNYQYATNPDGNSYILAANLEDVNNPVLKQNGTAPGDINGITCAETTYCIVF